MAWWALKKWFMRFRKSYYPDCRVLYKNFLYDEWFNSLSEEDQKEELRLQRELKEKRKREGELAVQRLLCMTAAMKNLACRNIDRPISYSDFLKSIF
jgi:hypothetical protein